MEENDGPTLLTQTTTQRSIVETVHDRHTAKEAEGRHNFEKTTALGERATAAAAAAGCFQRKPEAHPWLRVYREIVCEEKESPPAGALCSESNRRNSA